MALKGPTRRWITPRMESCSVRKGRSPITPLPSGIGSEVKSFCNPSHSSMMSGMWRSRQAFPGTLLPAAWDTSSSGKCAKHSLDWSWREHLGNSGRRKFVTFSGYTPCRMKRSSPVLIGGTFWSGRKARSNLKYAREGGKLAIKGRLLKYSWKQWPKKWSLLV